MYPGPCGSTGYLSLCEASGRCCAASAGPSFWPFDLSRRTHASQHIDRISAAPKTLPTPSPAFAPVDKPLSSDGAGVPVLVGASAVGLERVVTPDGARAVLEAGVERELLEEGVAGKALEAIERAVIWYCGLSQV